MNMSTRANLGLWPIKCRTALPVGTGREHEVSVTNRRDLEDVRSQLEGLVALRLVGVLSVAWERRYEDLVAREHVLLAAS